MYLCFQEVLCVLEGMKINMLGVVFFQGVVCVLERFKIITLGVCNL